MFGWHPLADIKRATSAIGVEAATRVGALSIKTLIARFSQSGRPKAPAMAAKNALRVIKPTGLSLSSTTANAWRLGCASDRS